MATRPHEIAPGHTAADWLKLELDPERHDAPDWQKAIQIFDDRIRGRFFDPVDELIGSEKRYGFSILAIDCLVMETLQGFREGRVHHHRKSKEIFKRFLLRWQLFTDSLPEGATADDLAGRFYAECRCALLHSGSTGEKLTVGISGKAFDFRSDGTLKINRTKLHVGLKKTFAEYLAELRIPESKKLRKDFKTKMDAIAGIAMADK